MFFYDWEPNVLGPGCKPDPTNANVTGGQSAGVASVPPAIKLFDAVTRASKCKPTNTGKETTGPQYYLVDTNAKKVLGAPGESAQDARDQARAKKIAPSPDQKIVTVPQGTIIVRAENDDTS